MDEVIVKREVFDKMVNIVASMPYVQVASILNEIGASTRPYHEEVTEDSDGD